eukprot:Skav234723  [mRNA]  locus=scaffold634:441313:442359:+ [translate_table: standard]
MPDTLRLGAPTKFKIVFDDTTQCRQVKSVLCERLGITWHHYVPTRNLGADSVRELVDDWALLIDAVEQGQCIYFHKVAFTVRFKLENTTRVKNIRLLLDATVLDLKHLVSDGEDIPLGDLRILLRGEDLYDDHQLVRDIPFDEATAFLVKCRGRGGGKTTDKPSEKSMVKQFMPKKKDKQEEYKDICENLNKSIGDISDGSAVISKVKAFVKHFASVPEGHSGSVVSEAVSNLDEERLKKCLAVLKKGNTIRNNGESKLEYIVKEMIAGVLRELTEHEKNVQQLKSALVLNLVKHCVNVSMRSGKVDAETIRRQMSDRLASLTTASTTKEDADVAMENLTDLFGRATL